MLLPHPDIVGLYLMENVITKKEQRELLKRMITVDGDMPISGYNIAREYGWPLVKRKGKYAPHTTIIKEDFVEIPEWIDELWKKIIDRTNMKEIIPDLNLYDNAYVNIYDKTNNSLIDHFDDPVAWTHWIIGLSIGEEIEMDFKNTKNINEKYKVKLPAYSVYVMLGDARYVYTHGFEKHEFNTLPKRVSITFRRINDKYLIDEVRKKAIRYV